MDFPSNKLPEWMTECNEVNSVADKKVGTENLCLNPKRSTAEKTQQRQVGHEMQLGCTSAFTLKQKIA